MESGDGRLPTGVVTFLLSDVESSTLLWDREPAAMAVALEEHDALIEAAVAAAGGTLLKARGEGDSTFSVFDRPTQAVAAALDARHRIEAHSWRRGQLGVHSGPHPGVAHLCGQHRDQPPTALWRLSRTSIRRCTWWS